MHMPSRAVPDLLIHTCYQAPFWVQRGPREATKLQILPTAAVVAAVTCMTPTPLVSNQSEPDEQLRSSTQGGARAPPRARRGRARWAAGPGPSARAARARGRCGAGAAGACPPSPPPCAPAAPGARRQGTHPRLPAGAAGPAARPAPAPASALAPRWLLDAHPAQHKIRGYHASMRRTGQWGVQLMCNMRPPVV